jgi:hypothetical protein
VIHTEVPLSHDLFQLSKAERIPQVPTNTQHDDLSFEVSSFEQRWLLPRYAAEDYQTAPSELQHYLVSVPA